MRLFYVSCNYIIENDKLVFNKLSKLSKNKKPCENKKRVHNKKILAKSLKNINKKFEIRYGYWSKKNQIRKFKPWL